MRPEYGNARVLLTKDYYLVSRGSGMKHDKTHSNCPQGRGSVRIKQPFELSVGQLLMGSLSECDILVINSGVHWHCV